MWKGFSSGFENLVLTCSSKVRVGRISERKKYSAFLWALLDIRINIYGNYYPFSMVRQADYK